MADPSQTTQGTQAQQPAQTSQQTPTTSTTGGLSGWALAGTFAGFAIGGISGAIEPDRSVWHVLLDSAVGALTGAAIGQLIGELKSTNVSATV